MRKRLLKFAVIFIIILTFSPKVSAEYSYPPIDIQANLFIKIFLFNNELNNGNDLVIHVIESSEFAAEMKKFIGKKIGKSKIAAVTEGTGLPSEKASIIYIGKAEKLQEVIQYTRKNKILSITGLPDLVEKGVTLGIGVLDKKPKILFNVSASKNEGMEWNPIILKISTLVK